jgi:hypothetical protein
LWATQNVAPQEAYKLPSLFGSAHAQEADPATVYSWQDLIHHALLIKATEVGCLMLTAIGALVANDFGHVYLIVEWRCNFNVIMNCAALRQKD